MGHLIATNHQNPFQSHFSCCINVLNNWEAGSEQDDVKSTKAGLPHKKSNPVYSCLFQCHRLGRLLLCKSCDNTMCIFINTGIHIFIYIYMMQPPRSPPHGCGYTRAMFPAPPCGWVGVSSSSSSSTSSTSTSTS